MAVLTFKLFHLLPFPPPIFLLWENLSHESCGDKNRPSQLWQSHLGHEISHRRSTKSARAKVLAEIGFHDDDDDDDDDDGDDVSECIYH